MQAYFGNEYDIKGESVPFYKLIPHLEDTIKTMLKSKENKDKNNKFLIIFDDLDIGFNSNDKSSIDTLIQLIRITKDYNINLFGKNKIDTKIILLIRDDIAKILINNATDTAKLFSSYEVTLNWYEHETYKISENLLKLKQFINKRIAFNFKKNKLKFDEDMAWKSLIYEDPQKDFTCFKYIIERTFYRPRDLILFFKPLSELKFNIPLQRSDINTLLNRFVKEVVSEIKNELIIHYSLSDINIIFNSLKFFSNHTAFSYTELKNKLEENRYSTNSINA